MYKQGGKVSLQILLLELRDSEKQYLVSFQSSKDFFVVNNAKGILWYTAF